MAINALEPGPASHPDHLRTHACLAAILALAFAICGTAGCQGLKREGGAVLRFDLHAIPEEIVLDETRRFLAEVVVLNTSNTPAVLRWESEQKADAALHAPDGTLLYRWSDDQSFSPEPSVMILNAGERAFFEMPVATRGMVAGKSHKLTARLLGSHKTEASLSIVPSATR